MEKLNFIMVLMRLSVNLICGGLMSRNLKINSKSDSVFLTL